MTVLNLFKKDYSSLFSQRSKIYLKEIAIIEKHCYYIPLNGESAGETEKDAVFSERFIHIHFGFFLYFPLTVVYVEQKFVLLQSLSISCQLILSAILQNAVQFQIEMEVVLEKTQPIYLPFEVLNNIRNVHASQQGLGRVILLKDNHQIKYRFSTIKG